MRLLVATTNPNKLAEIRSLLGGLDVELCALGDLAPIAEPEETGATFEENARLKALYYARASGLPTVAEDSGIEIEALGGAPGVQSARFPGATYPEKWAEVYRQLDVRGSPESAARFVCALAFVELGVVAFEALGETLGRVASEPRCTGGFGYDPIFFYPPLNQTLAELTDVKKAAVSHRGHAFRAFRRYLEEKLQHGPR